MKAAFFYGIDNLVVEEVPVPEITDDEILIKVKLASICGTDQRILHNGHFKIPEGTRRVLCHEMCGTIVKVGSNVNGYACGDRVATAPNVGCGTCYMCSQGFNHMCPDYEAFGISYDGGFEEYVRVPARAIIQGNVVKIPDEMSWEKAVLAEPFSCVYNSFEQLRTRPTDNVLIIGAGPIGAMHAILHQRAGAAKVIIADISGDRLEKMQAFGDFYTINTIEKNIQEELAKITGGHMADIVITACSVADVQGQALELAAPLGRVCLFGGLPSSKDQVVMKTNLIHYKELVVTAVTGSSIKQYRDSINIINSLKVDITPLISDFYPIEEINKAFETARMSKGMKTAIRFD